MDRLCIQFESGKLLKCHSNGKTCRKLANGQNSNNFKRKYDSGAICHNIMYISVNSPVSVYMTIGPLVIFICIDLKQSDNFV